MTTEPEHTAPERGAIPADTFAHRLLLARAHAGHVSIREAADLCGIGRGAWTNWEKGARPADIIEISTVVAAKLGIDRDWLLFGGELATAGARQRRSETRRQVINWYPRQTVETSTTPDRPRDNRPRGHAADLATTGAGRTAYVHRNARRRRDR